MFQLEKTSTEENTNCKIFVKYQGNSFSNFETCDIVRTAQNVLFVFYSLLTEKRPGKKESSADGILFLQKDKIRMHFT